MSLDCKSLLSWIFSAKSQRLTFDFAGLLGKQWRMWEGEASHKGSTDHEGEVETGLSPKLQFLATRGKKDSSDGGPCLVSSGRFCGGFWVDVRPASLPLVSPDFSKPLSLKGFGGQACLAEVSVACLACSGVVFPSFVYMMLAASFPASRSRRPLPSPLLSDSSFVPLSEVPLLPFSPVCSSKKGREHGGKSEQSMHCEIRFCSPTLASGCEKLVQIWPALFGEPLDP